jgi:hypothetical protein
MINWTLLKGSNLITLSLLILIWIGIHNTFIKNHVVRDRDDKKTGV